MMWVSAGRQQARDVLAVKWGDGQTDGGRGSFWVTFSAANRLIGVVVQSRRRPLLGPSPG